MYNENYQEDYLEHFGVPGMKWGVRKSGNTASAKSKRTLSEKVKDNKETRIGYRTDKGPTRYHMFNAANSAARTYYRKERTGDFRKYRKAERKLDLKEARLTTKEIKNGRYRVARARNIKRKTLSSVAGTSAGIALISAGAGALGIPVGVAVGVATNYASGGHYYSRQSSAYGNARSRYENQVKK